VSHRELPRWFKEGFAIYQSGEWSFGRTRALAGGVLSGRLLSLEAIHDQFPTSIYDIELAYAQSIDFVSFLLGEYGPAKFHRLVGLLRRGWSFFLAVEEAYDDGLANIEEAWHRDLKMRFTWIPVVTGTATLWFLATLVFLAAFLKRRRRKIEALEEMDDDPPLSAGS
jgi:MYXO-CTERM domain-containing protein